MAQGLRLISVGVAGFAARQPRIAVGGIGIGTVLLTGLAVTVLGHAAV